MTGPATWGASALRLTYDGMVALDDVSVAVTAGQVAAIVGGDGAGKTSLLRCVAGVLRPDEGQVHAPEKQRTGYLPASSGIYPDLTVAENLAFRAAVYGLSGPAAAERTAELTERAGLADARNRLAAQLSGGMRQKLGVIAALLHRPELLILDEPTTGVDPVSRSGLWWLIASAAADGAAVILATTYLDDAQRAASVLVLDAGRQLAAGTPDQIVSAMPGSVHATASRPDGVAGQRAWRRGAGWRVWYPPDDEVPGHDVPDTAGAGAVEPDLQDAVTVAALAREAQELAAVPASAAARGRGLVGLESAAPQSAAAQSASLHAPDAQSAGPEPVAPLAESIGVTCRFGSFTAVSDVSIQVRRGEIVGLLGANGAGKTTLIRMLLGLVPATAGEVLLLGEPPSRAIRRRIGYVPQGLGLYEDLTPAENMQFAAAVFGVRAGSRVRAGESQARQTGSRAVGADPSRVPVGRLPLGIQRRTAFAQALAHQPDLLILDEPTSGVDPLGRARLWQAIADAVQGGAGALVSTHYMEEAGECDRLIIMADGVVVAAGTAAEIIGDAQVTVVQAEDWAAAFARLERAGLPVSLAGRVLRVPGADPDEVRRALPGGCRVYIEPATLEERFFDLVLASGRTRVPA